MITPERLAETADELLAAERAITEAATRIADRGRPLERIAEDSSAWWLGARSDRYRSTSAAIVAPIRPIGRAVTDATVTIARARQLADDLAARLTALRRVRDSQANLLALVRRDIDIGRASPEDERRILGTIRSVDRERAEIETRWLTGAGSAADAIMRIATSIPDDPTPARFTVMPLDLLGDRFAGLPVERPGPAVIARRWARLPVASRRAMIQTLPGIVGNLDGIPFADRASANRRSMQQVLDEAEPGTESWAAMQQFTDRGNHRRIDAFRRYVVFDPSGDGLVAEVFGDIARADHVAVLVPGMGSTLANFHDLGRRAARLHRASGTGSAVIAWTGYDTPHAPAFTPLVLEAVSDRQAAIGGARLRSFADGIRIQSTATLTLVGHSYGSLTVGNAMQHGASVDRVVFMGSPGVGTDRVTGFPTGGASEYFASEIKGDIVADLEWFGPNPTDPDFGASVFDSGDGDGLDPFARHGEYYDDGIAIENLATIVTGGWPTPGRTDLIDYVTEPLEDVRDATSGGADRLRAFDIPLVDDTLIDHAILTAQRYHETVSQIHEVIIEQVGHFGQDAAEWRIGQ
ncbi:MAG: alpha/beta hydrolase [Ilumatobacter sp.]